MIQNFKLYKKINLTGSTLIDLIFINLIDFKCISQGGKSTYLAVFSLLKTEFCFLKLIFSLQGLLKFILKGDLVSPFLQFLVELHIG